MSQLSAVLSRRTLSSASLLGCRLGTPSTTTQSLARSYSRKTNTKIQVEASELEREIRQLEKTIAEQERKAAAKKAYEESIRESKSRTEAAHSVYKSISSPMAPSSSLSSSSASKPGIGSGLSKQSFLPETFLEDLKLTFLDTRGTRGDTLKQLQSGLPSAQELAATTSENKDSLATNDKDANALALERIQNVGVDKWNQLIYVNALEGNARNAEETIKLMEEVGVQPNIDTFGHLIEAYANAGELKKAQDTIELILKSGLVPSISSYNSLMKIHVKRRDITSAFKVFEALKEHHNPDVEVFTNLVKGCLRAGEYDLGWKVFDQMQHSGATPVESTYSLMIHACAKTDQVERALDIFKTYPNRRLQPTDATFNSLIHACAMRPEYFATAFALLNEMQNVYGFEPDVLTYNTLLFACSKRQDLLTARRVFQKVVQLDHEGKLQSDGVTVTNFLWCITEWKDTDVHLRNLKYRQRNPTEASKPSMEPSVSSASSTAMAVASPYFLLPERPPKNEQEALAEGESVFNWFTKRSADQFPITEVSQEKLLEDTTEQTLGQDNQVATKDPITSALSSLPKSSRQSPIRTRLLNAYLAMYVRHHDIEKSTEIYRHYFSHFQRKRDSWTYSTMLEGCYNWKDVDLGTEVFRDWRDWRKSTGKLTEKRARQADYQCYRRMINLLARTNHLDESIALLEELSIAATPTNTRLLADIASSTPPSTHPTALSTTTEHDTKASSLSFLSPIQDEHVLPIYPKLKDFPVVYTKTWEMEDEAARKLVLRLCQGKDLSGSSSSSSSSRIKGEDEDKDEDKDEDDLFAANEKRQARYQKSLRNTSIKWKGEHPQEKGFYVGPRRIKELDRDVTKRGQDRRR
ncbi:hypothetical protein MVEG_07544 [Podila verticillata NRRL 6337]|nr:hypothetical protein MVEG_07544 [Podila verticillata NRRL 6337]